jgi:hypothetical protein
MTHTDIQPTAEPRRDSDAGEADLEDFLAGLTELSLKCGIGIADAPTLYLLEREDRDYAYATDKDGKLVLR